MKPSSAAKGNATSLLENADFTRQNVATPAHPKEITAKNYDLWISFAIETSRKVQTL